MAYVALSPLLLVFCLGSHAFKHSPVGLPARTRTCILGRVLRPTFSFEPQQSSVEEFVTNDLSRGGSGTHLENKRTHQSRKSFRSKFKSPMSFAGSFIPGQEVLTLGSEVCGVAFSFFTILKGLVGMLAPGKLLNFYGIDLDSMYGEDKKSISQYTKNLGAAIFNVGLTAALALRSELSLLGHMPSPGNINRCIVLGFIIPNVMAALTQLNGVVDALLTPLFYLFLWWLVKIDKVGLGMVINIGLFFGLLGGITYFFTATAGDDSSVTLIQRLLGLYSILYAVLVSSLRSPSLNALPSIGLTAFTWSLGHLYMMLFTKDFEKNGCSMSTVIGSIAGGIAVAAGGLRHYLVM